MNDTTLGFHIRRIEPSLTQRVDFRRDDGGLDIPTRIVTVGPIALDPHSLTISMEEVNAG